MKTEFTPNEFQTLTVEFEFTPEEPRTYSNPGIPAEIEFVAIYMNGEKLEDSLADFLIESFGDDWERDLFDGKYIQ